MFTFLRSRSRANPEANVRPRTFPAGMVRAAVKAPVVTALAAAMCLSTVSASAQSAADDVASFGSSPTMVGGWSEDQAWFNANIGPLEIYRGFSSGFKSSWSQTGYASRPGRVDYSFNMSPSAVAGNRDAIRRFFATTPKNLIISYFPEPEVSTTPTAFRAATRIVADVVHAQNRADGGNRLVEVILMGYTFRSNSGRNPMDWWPGRDASGRNYADIISTDVYSDPQGPNTENGYTNGVNWRSAEQLFDPTVQFANRVGARWSVSEFGYLEDPSRPGRKAQAITDAVNYAKSHRAVAVEYWDSIGRRGDWRLRHSSTATAAFRQAVQTG